MGGLIVIVGTVTLLVVTGVNVMGMMVYFGFSTLRDSSDVCFIIMSDGCSRDCICLTPMGPTRPGVCGFCRFTMMYDSAFLVISGVGVSVMGYSYRKN